MNINNLFFAVIHKFRNDIWGVHLELVHPVLHFCVEELICVFLIKQDVVITEVADAFVTSLSEFQDGEVVFVEGLDFQRIPHVKFFGKPPFLVDSLNALPVIAQVLVNIKFQIVFVIHDFWLFDQTEFLEQLFDK